MPYDQTNPESIETYGKRLIGGSLATVQGVREIPREELVLPVSGRTRGSLGNIVENYYYDIHPTNDGSPDFKKAGVELKTTPVKKNGNGSYVAKERLVLGMIDYLTERDQNFNSSKYFTKNQKLMLLSYLHEKDKKIGEVKFLLAKLFEFDRLPKEDQRIIREDWEKINKKVREDKAHELSEGDTLYLGACTKSATGNNRRKQLNGPDAKPRAFSYKPSYMNQLIKRELGASEDVEKLLSETEIAEDKTFEQQVLERFTPYIGRTVSDIAEALEVEVDTKNYGDFAKLARAMLGVKKNKIEEFEAAEVVMKTIQLRADGMPHQHMSFPTFKYSEVINEVWDADEEDGETRAGFQKQLETRFLFVVYRCEDKCAPEEKRIFEKAFFWTMPAEDLLEAQRVWEETIQLINEGKIVKNIKQNKKGKDIRETYFPASLDSEVAHVRPHGLTKYTNPLPFEDKKYGFKGYTNHCFWLNKSYLKNIVDRY